MTDKIAQIEKEARAAVASATLDTLYDVEVAYLGKKGKLTRILKSLGSLSKEERPLVGKEVNRAKGELQEAIEARKNHLAESKYSGLADSEWIDTSIDRFPLSPGTLHPITRIQYELEDIFGSIGFSVYDGPHIETEFNNFESLNIPSDHPARDSQDTFWLKNGHLLRTQTSAMQVPIYRQLTPPFRVIVPGKVFRYEATDATHENTFHQLEGFMVGEGIQIGDLVYILKLFLKRLFDREVEVRLRPGYFPFVEPGLELDFQCFKCAGKGCPMCKQSGWIELLGCGMIHPVVLRYGNIDPERYTGFAFGVGLDRIAMMRYKIADIRLFHGGDLRQLRQFY